jgi:hypothetical protein
VVAKYGIRVTIGAPFTTPMTVSEQFSVTGNMGRQKIV